MRDALIKRFDLLPHPEGGYYSETFRSADHVRREGAPDTMLTASTAIYYMLCDGAHSAWHRIKSDEVWHFYAGEPIDIHVIDADGGLETRRLGNALEHPDAAFQAIVPAGRWFAAELHDPTSFALVGCTVAPGFEFSEFELADVRDLSAASPAYAEIIKRLGPRTG
jgi:predicted cupin superfamily sugar epimerase